MRNSARSLGFVLVLAILVLGPGHSYGLSIGFVPFSQEVILGNQAGVDLVITGLGDGTSPSLAEFDLSIAFDPDIIAVNTFSFGDQLDILGLGSVQFSFVDNLGGALDLYELSLDPSEDLDFFQAESFVLASLTFDTLGLGTSPLDILPPVGSMEPVFGDPLGNALEVEISSGSIEVVTSGTEPVPEPGTILLLGSGLFGLAGLRRKFG